MPKIVCSLILLAALFYPHIVRADATRAVQEELRKRNLFYGDVDGRQTPSLIEAIKQYQQRKGFAVTGEADADTLRSLGISAPQTRETLPAGPVLTSDRSMNTDRVAPESTPPVPPPPRHAPEPTREEMKTWLRRYLDAAQTPNVDDELAFYADQVDYFHHGTVAKPDIRRQLEAYAQQWPTRRYLPGNALRLTKKGDTTVVRSRINFELQNGSQQAVGKADKTFTLVRRPDLSWQIVAHKEERVRSSGGHSSKKVRQRGNLTPLDRTLRKFFGSGAHRTHS